jgi:hypothetical protein
MSKRRSEKLEEAYTKQDKALRKLAEIEQQIFDLEGSYLEGASLKVRAATGPGPPTSAADRPVWHGNRAGTLVICARIRSGTPSLHVKSASSLTR